MLNTPKLTLHLFNVETLFNVFSVEPIIFFKFNPQSSQNCGSIIEDPLLSGGCIVRRPLLIPAECNLDEGIYLNPKLYINSNDKV